MNFTPVKTPIVLKRAFPNMVWHMPTTEKVIYLTFDDGPTPEITDWTLNVLKQYNAEATFFCIGKNVEEHPDIFKRILEHGHSVGNHTQNHIKGWNTKTNDYLKDIEEADMALKAQILKSKIKNRKSKIVNLFRPPYGRITPLQSKAISKKGFQIIMWTILSLDWDKTISKEKCADNVINNASSGDIIVFHDSVKAAQNMQYALSKVLDYFSKEGFVFKRIPELNQ